jgi:hypothetical protein
MRRARYHKGVARPRKSGDVWLYRFRETLDGRRVQRNRVIGSVAKYRTEAAARRAVELIRVNLNADRPATGPVMRFAVLSDHYCLDEISIDNHVGKS